MTEDEDLEEEVTYYVFVKKGRRHYAPQYLTVGMTTVERIFPVPEPNAVGTLDEHSNGIVLIRFGGHMEKPECQVVAQNVSETVCGPFYYRFSRNFSEDSIVYSKAGIVVAANIKTGEAFHAGYGLSIGERILGIRFLAPQNNLFAVVKSVDEGGGRYEDYLCVARLEERRLIDTGWSLHLGKTRRSSPDFPLYNTWDVHNNRLFAYDDGRLSCTDGSRPVPHPFSEIFNENVSRIGVLKDFAIHPTLPFGVIFVEGVSMSRNFTVLRWDIAAPKKLDEQVSFNWDLYPLAPLFGLERMVLAYQSFSPDGNWYVVGCVAPEAPKDPYFVAVPVIPVDKKHPDFLDTDNLVVLGQVKGMASIAWTSDPTAYVVSDGELLHKWDLDELPAARVFVMPDGEGKRNVSFFGRIGRLFGKRGS